MVQKLAESTSLEEFVNRMRGTPYSDVLATISPPYTARKLELLFRERMAKVHHSIVTGAGRYGIMKLYYMRNIAWDLKTVLKAKALGRPYEETMEFLDMKAEELVGRRDLIVKVLTAANMNEAVSALSGTEFFADVEKAFAAYSAQGEVRLFDVYIDHAVLSAISSEYSVNHSSYKSSRGADVAGVSDIVTLDIDAYNVLTMLRARLWGLQESEIQSLVITPPGRVQSSVLVRLAAVESVAEAVKLFESSYPLQLAGQANDESAIDQVEDMFSKMLLQTASKAFVWQGLSPGATLALIKLIEFEVGNLSAIAIGLEAGIEAKSIIAKLRI